MNLIENLLEPKKLLLIWQAPRNGSSVLIGPRYVVGEIIKSDDEARLKYYNNEDVNSAVEKGFEGLTAYPYQPNKNYDNNIIDSLSRRITPSSRGDYNDYLKFYGISPTAKNISVFSLLAYTGGKLEGDGFSFAHTLEVEAPFEYIFEIAGFRYHDGMKIDNILSLQDKEVTLIAEEDNSHDPDAVAVIYEDYKLGYVPKGLNRALKRFISNNKITASISSINGSPHRPIVLVYLQVE